MKNEIEAMITDITATTAEAEMCIRDRVCDVYEVDTKGA